MSDDSICFLMFLLHRWYMIFLSSVFGAKTFKSFSITKFFLNRCKIKPVLSRVHSMQYVAVIKKDNFSGSHLLKLHGSITH